MVTLFPEQGLPTMREVGVKVAPRDVPSPDVMVLNRPLTAADLDRSQFDCRDVARVVEVVSEESRDRNTLTVDATVSIFKLPPAGTYEISARHELSQLRPLSL